MFKRLCPKGALGDLPLVGAICGLKLWLRIFHEEFKMQGHQLILGMHSQPQVNHSKQAKKAKFQVRVERQRTTFFKEKENGGEHNTF